MESVRGVVRRAVNILSKQHQMGPKALAVNPQTSYGPESRGFESLRTYQSHGNSLNFRGFVYTFACFVRRRIQTSAENWDGLSLPLMLQ